MYTHETDLHHRLFLHSEQKSNSDSKEKPRTVSLHVYPNPSASGLITLTYGIPYAGKTVIRVSDIMNREKFLLVNEVQEAGVFTAHFDGTSLKNGIYFCTLQIGQITKTQKIVISK